MSGQEDGVLSSHVLRLKEEELGLGLKNLREHLPLRRTSWPGLLTDGSVETEGTLAGPDSGQPYRDIKS